MKSHKVKVLKNELKRLEKSERIYKELYHVAYNMSLRDSKIVSSLFNKVEALEEERNSLQAENKQLSDKMHRIKKALESEAPRLVCQDYE